MSKLPGMILFGSFFLFSFWLMFHTFSYDTTSHAMMVSQKVWSDFAQHIPMVRSFSTGDALQDLVLRRLPEHPLFPGEAIRYHFLFYALVGLLEKTGLRIDWALNIPSSLGFFLLISTIYLLADKLFHDKKIAILSVILFLFNGSLSFLRFFTDHPVSLSTLFDILNNSSFPSFAPWDNGEITAFWNLNIYTNQRHLALAFGIALLFLIFLRPRLAYARRGLVDFILAVFFGVLFGLFPYFHQPTLVILAVFMATYFIVFPKLRTFLFLTGLITALIALPQLANLLPTSSAYRLSPITYRSFFYPGYLIHNSLSVGHLLRFWWLNLGLHAILIPLGFFLAPKPIKKFFLPIFVVFAIGNLFKFSPEAAANHKFFNFFLILGNMLSAYALCRMTDLIHKQKNVYLTVLSSFCLIVLLFFLTLSGIIDFMAVFHDPKGTILDGTSNKTSDWIAQYTPKDAVFLNSSFLYHPASLAGRKIFQGWPYFTWSEGYTEDRTILMKIIYESKSPTVFCPILKQRNIRYITVEDTHGDTNLPVIDVDYFTSYFLPSYTNSDRTYFIFSRDDLCQTTL